MSNWTYQGQVFETVPSGKPEGFVYRITNLLTGKQYLGKKSFWATKTYQVKGKKKKMKVESNWREYHGSNEILQNDVVTHGESNFKREILSIHETKSLLSYYEAKIQFEEDVLLKPDQYYNSWIMVRVRTAHVVGKSKK